MITPVFAGDELIAFAANRAHHADVGGPTPGSMPADSRTLADEGVVIEPRVLDEDAIAELVAQMRQPDQRRADLRAQLAAGRVGARRLAELEDRVGRATLTAAFSEVLDYAERRTRACLEALADGTLQRPGRLRGPRGRPRRSSWRRPSRATTLILDFTGTAPQHDGNLNCPLAVTRSACYFAVRVLTDPDIPPSAGAYRPVEVRAPEGCLLNARSPAAVVGGNVETSSRVADVVLRAFGRALGQGTMNNVTIGNEEVVYYETIGGGQGACPDADGPSGGPRGDEQHAQHADRGARARVPDARRRVRPAARLRRPGRPSRRRRRGARARGARAAALLADHGAPTPRAARSARAGRTARAAATCWTARRLRRRPSAGCEPGQRLRIETPGGGGYGAYS